MKRSPIFISRNFVRNAARICNNHPPKRYVPAHESRPTGETKECYAWDRLEERFLDNREVEELTREEVFEEMMNV